MENVSLIFDVDDTLVQTSKTALEKEKLVAETLKLEPVSEEAFFACYGHLPFEECVKVWHPEIDVLSYRRQYEAAKQVYPYKPIGRPSETVGRLLDLGTRVGILTNGSGRKMDQKLKAAGIMYDMRARLSFCLCADNMEFRKPDPRVFDKPIAILKRPRSEVYYIGDSIDDFRAATGAKINFVGVLSGFTDKKSFIEAGLDDKYLIQDMSKVQEFIRSMP